MTSRVLPAPDPFSVGPLGGPILPFYDGTFEAAFVILSPFLRRRSDALQSPAQGREDLLDAQAVCQRYEAVRWSEVRELCGFPSTSSVDVALRTLIGGLKPSHADSALADALSAALQQKRWLPPVEGEFPELVQTPMLSFFQSLGHDWLWVGDELGTERKLHWIDDLKPVHATSALARGNLFTPDKANLWTVHWDSHYTLFCGSAFAVERLAGTPELEGFVCDRETDVYWSLQYA